MENKLEIKKQTAGNLIILSLSGRIDAYWADELDKAIQDEVRIGNYSIELDMSGVIYISSAGIRVLVKYLKQLKQLNGELSLSNLSSEVESVLSMVGLLKMFKSEKSSAAAVPVAEMRESEGIIYSIKELSTGAIITAKVVGDPDYLKSAVIADISTKKETFPKGKFGIGIGAFGENLKDCIPRFGEFFACSGTAACLPGDGSKKPDFQLAAGQFIPEINTLYGAVFEGKFSYMAVFKQKDSIAPPALYDLVELIMNESGKDNLAIVMAAEATGLVGASLKKSPVKINEGELFSFPNIRENINFTTERAYADSLAVVAGFAVKSHKELLALARPMKANTDIYGHFHAAVFPFSPIKKDISDISEILSPLFENYPLETILHLLNDEREILGVGQSEFSHGNIWFAEIQ